MAKTTQVDLKKVVKPLRELQLAYRALNHKLRIDILDFLQKSKGCTVTELYVKFRLEQSVASQHLAILRRHLLVDTERQGKFIIYKANEYMLNELVEFAKSWANEFPKTSTPEELAAASKGMATLGKMMDEENAVFKKLPTGIGLMAAV